MPGPDRGAAASWASPSKAHRKAASVLPLPVGALISVCSPEAIAGVNLPTGVPLVYELREDFSVADRRYLGDPAAVQAKMNAVANQGKAQPGPAPARPRP